MEIERVKNFDILQEVQISYDSKLM